MNIIFKTCAQFIILFTSPTQHYCALSPLFWRGGTGVRTPPAQACSLYPIHNSLYIPHTALLRTAPSLLERGNGGEELPLAQACSLCPIHNSLYIPHTALLRTVPSLLERGNGGEDSSGASLQLVPNS